MKAEGWSVMLYCRSTPGAACHHSWRPSWDQVIQYFGQDFDITGDRAAFARLRCEECGGQGASVIVQPNDIKHRASGGHRHGPDLVSIDEATDRYHKFEKERRRLGIKSIAEANAESRAALKAQRNAAKSGTDFIGPPNPREHRKRGRWL